VEQFEFEFGVRDVGAVRCEEVELGLVGEGGNYGIF
jgi:hypothetical protein